MNSLLNSRFFYFLLPVYFSLVLIFIFFNIPSGFGLSLSSLFVIVTPILMVSKLLYPWGLKINVSYELIFIHKSFRRITFFLCLIIFLSGPLDVFVNGFKLLDPSSYADFNGYGRYIRHISSMCWILVPISFIFLKNKRLKSIFVLYAIIFPIFIIDRNRLFMAFYSLIFCFSLASLFLSNNSPSKIFRKYYIYLLLIILILIFSLLGLFRSGDAFLVGTSGDILIRDSFPLNDLFYSLPELFQQIVLYVTTPIFNFATIVYYDFSNETFLLSQLSPFGRELFDSYPEAPVMVERFNVGTEFYPWLLYGGLPLVVLSFSFMLFSFLCAAHLLKRCPNIFTLLIFLRISYTVLFMGFAPQFYILLNFAFVFLMMILWGGAVIMQSVFICPENENENENEKEEARFAKN